MDKRDREGAFFWVEERNEPTPIPLKHKRKVKSKKMEFIGWGSRPLVEFLESIGKDSSKQLSQYDATAIINEYVNKLNLFHPLKKKKIVCDERLRSLFGKKFVPRIKIYDLLQSHFAENHDSSEDDLSYSSDEYADSDLTCKKQKVHGSEKKTPSHRKKVLEIPINCFAAIIPENIKLLYLKRSLVQELLKHPESFEGKLLGSYIRVKSDPNDYFQKNSHQLLPVTGVKNVLPQKGDVLKEVRIQVPNMVKDIPISTLSDDDFSKEECEDLCQRVKNGLLKRPTVAELEEKAQILHEDITKHWLPRELVYLQKLIDRANEKGWRKELFEYLERRKLLQTPSEQSRLLLEVPKVIADESKPEATPQDRVHDVEQLNSSPISTLRDTSLIAIDSGANQALSSRISDAAGSSRDMAIPSQGALNCLFTGGERNVDFANEKACIGKADDEATDIVGEEKANGEAMKNKTLPDANVIELSDDEDGDARKQEQEKHDFTRRMWFYLDPQGHVQGPVSGIDLSRWNDAGYFLPDFKIWKDGQTADEAILLTDMLSGK